MKIVIKNLSKSYNQKDKALSNINLELTPDKIIGIVGPNGAGKTTLLNCIAGLLKYEEGEIIFIPKDLNYSIGYYPEKFELPDFMRGIDFLRFISIMKDDNFQETQKIIDDLGKNLNLPMLEKFIGEYSKGQKEKVLFLSVLIGNPKILIFDEPFTGIDILTIEFLKQYIKTLKSPERIITISSHIPELIATLCDEVYIIKGGVIQNNITFNSNMNLEEKINMLINSLNSEKQEN